MASCTFDTTLIRPGVRWYHGQNCKKIKISDFLTDLAVKSVDINANPAQSETEDVLDTFEDCVLMGVLLNVIHGSTSSVASKSIAGSQYGNSLNSTAGTKRSKNNNAAPYDRMFIFGDVNDPPNCFAVMCDTARESRMLTEHSFNEVAVGRVFCLLEPRKTDKFIGHGDLPIVSLTVPLVPLSMENKIEVLPAVMSAPGDVGKQMFFVYHNLPIQLSYFYIATDDVSCAGILCDRQHRLKQNTSCACLHNGKANKPIVADFNVRFRSDLPGGRSEIITVKRCRSIRTTVMFFDDFMSFQQLSREETIQRTMVVRTKVRTMVNTINRNGGWTLVGWCKKGEVSDAANRFEKIESDDVTYHISLLQPTVSTDIASLNKVKTGDTEIIEFNDGADDGKSADNAIVIGRNDSGDDNHNSGNGNNREDNTSGSNCSRDNDNVSGSGGGGGVSASRKNDDPVVGVAAIAGGSGANANIRTNSNVEVAGLGENDGGGVGDYNDVDIGVGGTGGAGGVDGAHGGTGTAGASSRSGTRGGGEKSGAKIGGTGKKKRATGSTAGISGGSRKKRNSRGEGAGSKRIDV